MPPLLGRGQVATNGDHAIGPALIRAARAVLRGGAAKVAHGQHQRVVETVAQVLRESRETLRETFHQVSIWAADAALVGMGVPAVIIDLGYLEPDVALDQLRDLLKLPAEIGPHHAAGALALQLHGQLPGRQAINLGQYAHFCSTKYNISFPLLEKTRTRGPGQSPVYQFLTTGHRLPGWNFHKYLVGKDGNVIREFTSQTSPQNKDLRDAIDAALKN